MAKTVTASEAKNRLGSIMDWAVDNEDEVVIEKRGKPRVVMMSFSQYTQLSVLRERVRRAEALARLKQAAAEIQESNKDLTTDEAEALADEVMSETIERMIDEQKISYEK